MDYVYKLKIDKQVIDGEFFYDSKFGFFFFTGLSEFELLDKHRANLVVKDNLVSLESSNDGPFVITRTVLDNKVAYAFSLFGEWDTTKVNALTTDILTNKEESHILSYESLANYLAAICELPTGNFVIGNVQDYINVIEELSKKHPDKEAFFRGHYSYHYLLVPSLYRKKKYFDYENFIYMDFKTQFYNELASKKYIEILTTMQHYQMPTRLLDTTSNPLVALFMAIDKPTNYKQKGFDVGEVISMFEEHTNVKYSDSNAVTLLSCLAVLETNYKQELYEKITESIEKKDSSIYKTSLAYKRFVAEVTNELPCFDESFFTPEVLLHPRHVKVGMINERIIAQSGSFILFGLCNYVTGEYAPLNTVSKERVFVVNRERIMKQLDMLNINTGTMYPDKDHMAREIIKSYE